MVKIKICGITSREDARMAINSGADAIGVIVNVPEKSPRKVDIQKAREIFKEISPFVSSVVVLIPSSLKEVENVVRKLNPDIVQLHGDESLEFVSKLRGKVKQKIIKVVKVGGNFKTVKKAKKFSRMVDAILLDTEAKSQSGGTGITHDWRVSARVRETIFPRPLILAGGLTSGNVEKAITIVKPYAVDVSSSVEMKLGRKDEKKIRKFIQNAKR